MIFPVLRSRIRQDPHHLSKIGTLRRGRSWGPCVRQCSGVECPFLHNFFAYMRNFKRNTDRFAWFSLLFAKQIKQIYAWCYFRFDILIFSLFSLKILNFFAISLQNSNLYRYFRLDTHTLFASLQRICVKLTKKRLFGS
jgi:hypothetical protein